MNVPLMIARVRLNLARGAYREAKTTMSRTNKWAAGLPPAAKCWVKAERSAAMASLNRRRAELTRAMLATHLALGE